MYGIRTWFDFWDIALKAPTGRTSFENFLLSGWGGVGEEWYCGIDRQSSSLSTLSLENKLITDLHLSALNFILMDLVEIEYPKVFLLMFI